jgi:hypothetical protein
MKKYLPSGAEMVIVTNETGGFDITIIGPYRAFDSIEEALPIIYSDTQEVYSTLKVEGIVSEGGLSPQKLNIENDIIQSHRLPINKTIRRQQNGTKKLEQNYDITKMQSNNNQGSL